MSAGVDLGPAAEVGAAVDIDESPTAAPGRRDAQPTAPPEAPAGPARGSAAIPITISVLLTLALLLGFVAYLIGFSTLSERHAQHALRESFSKQLGEATAPVGAAHEGRPVAVLDIPAIGVHSVVVEGTSSRDLMSGPGHLPGTVLPGQPGVSSILGHRATFGAPFDRLLELKVGDTVTVTTGQGRNRYVVSSFGSTKHPAPANSANRLLLTTAGDGLISPGTVVTVSADLTSHVHDFGGVGATAANQLPLARDVGRSIIPFAGWAQLLLLTAIAGTLMIHRGPRWPVLICLGPITLAVVWNVYENAAGLLPNVL